MLLPSFLIFVPDGGASDVCYCFDFVFLQFLIHLNISLISFLINLINFNLISLISEKDLFITFVHFFKFL